MRVYGRACQYVRWLGDKVVTLIETIRISPLSAVLSGYSKSHEKMNQFHITTTRSINAYPNKLSVDHNSSVRMQALTGNVAAILAGKEDEASGNLAGLSRASDWHATELLHSFGCHRCWNQGSPN